MLILTSRISETVMIGEKGEITVTVLGIKGGQVRIGYSAPKEIPVHRQKIFNRIQNERSKEDENHA